MHIAVLGINHKTASVELREQVALSDDTCRMLVTELAGNGPVQEAVALSTCNRTEVYVGGPELPLRDAGLDCLSRVTEVKRSILEDHLYYYENREAVRHLFLVGSSLDSMVLGEAQILHQLKEAYGAAEQEAATGVLLNRLLRCSFEVGKRVRTETQIGQSSLSIASVSVDLARNVFGDLAERPVLVVGAGEMAELVVTHLRGHGVAEVMVANRTYERAVALAEKFGGTAVRFTPSGDERPDGTQTHDDALLEHLAKADIVITSTGSAKAIISRDLMERVMKRRRNRPVFIIDIAVPRDVEAAVARVYNAYLYDIDDLEDVVASNLEERKQEAEEAKAIVDEEVAEFEEWRASLEVVPTVVALRSWAASVKDEEVAKYLARMPDLSQEEREKVEALAHSIVNKLLHPPTVRLKEAAGEGRASAHEASLRALFDLNGVAGDGAVNERGDAPSHGIH